MRLFGPDVRIGYIVTNCDFMDSLKLKITYLGEILENQKKTAIIVCTVILLSAIFESIGVSMILPIMQVILDGSPQGKLALVFNPLLNTLPKYYILPVLCSVFVFFLGLKFISGLIKVYITKRFSWKLWHNWLEKIFKRYMHSEYRFILNHKQGILLNDLTNEPLRGAICLSQLTEYVARLVLLVALYIPLLLTQWQATIFMSAVLGFMLLGTHKLSNKYAQKVGKQRLSLKQNISGWGSEAISGIRQVKAFGLENWFANRFSRIVRKLYRIELRFAVIRSIPSNFSEMVLGLMIVLFILYLHLFMDISLSTLVPTIALFLLVGQRIFINVSSLAALRMQIIGFLPSLRLVHDLSSHKIQQESLNNGAMPGKLKKDIEFRDIVFGYQGETTIFSKLNLTIPHGKITAIIGPSGFGKSTIADLLLGLHRPKEGRIMINDRCLSELSLEGWRKCIGYVSQDTYLFNMKIKKNISLDKNSEDSDQLIFEAAKRAYAHEFISKLPEAYDTIVGDRGVKLSGGQRQRIAIARAIFRDPDLLIFDEATSALDDESEQKIQKAIEDISKEKTTLIIAHRLSTIKNADVVYDLSNLEGVTANSPHLH